MKRLIGSIAAASLLALAVVGIVSAQTGNYLPVPSNVFAAKGAVAVAQDQNNLTGIAAVAAGQVLSSQGVGALPAWSAAPALSGGVTVGGSGTAVTQIKVYAPNLTPAAVVAQTCVEQSFAVTGIATTDKLIFNPPTIAASPGVTAVAARASAADTVAVVFCNPSATLNTPAAGIYAFVAVRS